MRILYYETLEDHPNIIAYFDVAWGDPELVTRNWKVLRSKKGGWFAVSPSCKRKDEFLSVIEIPEEQRAKFFDKLHEVLRTWVEDGSQDASELFS